jgi:hypothetical protein
LMGPTTPETSGIDQSITTLKSKVTEIPWTNEIKVKMENVGAQKWPEMLAATQSDGRERGMNVFRNPLTGKFTPGEIVIGGETGFEEGNDIPILSSEIGLRSMFYDHVATVHTHPMTAEDAHLKTTVPSGNDIRKFLGSTYSAMVVIDRGGAHLLIRTRELMQGEPLPSPDLIKNKIAEVKAKDGIVTDVQKALNAMLAQYGLRYYYTEELTPSADGTIAFKTP